MRAVYIFVTILGTVLAVVEEPRAASWDFENSKVGELPKGWTSAKTGEGPGSVWKIREDSSAPSGKKVLAQTSSQGPNRLFNLAVVDASSHRDLTLWVSFKALGGKLDQGGGPVWRYQDANNYYIARMNPLEDNYRVYKVVEGRRIQLGSAAADAPAGGWHSLRIVHQGEHIRCFLNGKQYLDVKDATFTGTGKIGLWTKADAVTSFDDLSVVDEGTEAEKWRPIDQSQYVGAKKCAQCHEAHFDGWKDTAHNKMIRPAIRAGPNRTILADFDQPSPDRNFQLEDVKWVIGHRWKQRYIGEVDGKEVVFPAQWSVDKKIWQPYRGRNDWWYPHHQDWKTRSNFELCAGCHSTGVDHYEGSWVELNISCESCHGPGKAHSANPIAKNIVNPSRLSRDRSIEICLSCHQAGKPQGTQYAWAVGYQPGMELSKFWQGFDHEEGKETAEWWHNGTAHKNRVQGNTFLQSVMYHAGMQCTDCHDQHGSRHTSMTFKSAKTNALCLTCHAPGKEAGLEYESITEHTHHAPTSTGSRCIECHMPKTGKNSVAGESRNHTFDFISPADTIEHGVPNSCNICHADQTPEWALSALKKWSEKNGS